MFIKSSITKSKCQLIDVKEAETMEIRLKVEDIDYASLIEKLLPLVANKLQEEEGAVEKLLLGLTKIPSYLIKASINAFPQETKDDMIAYLVNKNSENIEEILMDSLKQKGVTMKISDMRIEN